MKPVTPTIKQDRLLKLAEVTLKSGGHGSRDEGMCAMEAVAWLAGRKHTDHPPCVSPVIGAFVRNWNDSLPSDEDRDRLLKPLLPDLIGTATTAADDERRAWMATDWLVRVHTPAWLRLAGLEQQAAQLESLGELSPESTPAILPTLQAVRSDAAAARDAAWAAAGAAAWAAAWAAARAAAGAAAWVAARDAARAAAGAAARDAAWAAAGDAAWDAAWDAAGAAARDAAWDAAKKKLQPTVIRLQASAGELLKRMAAVGKET